MKVKINDDHSVSVEGGDLGREQEHEVEIIEVELPANILNFYINLEFVLPNKEKYLTEDLDGREGSFTYSVPSGLLAEKGVVLCQLVARSKETVWKSNMWEMAVGQSINATETIPGNSPDWLSRLAQATEEAETAANAAREASEVALNSRGPQGTSIRFMGEWTEGVSYVSDAEHIDVVGYQGDVYRCKTTHIASQTPDTDTANYELLVKKGEAGAAGKTGATGTSIRFKGQWVENTEYVCNAEYIDVVSYRGSLYRCIQTHTSSADAQLIPDRKPAYVWELIVEKGETGDATFTNVAEANNVYTLDLSKTLNFKLSVESTTPKSIALINAPDEEGLLLSVSILIEQNQNAPITYPVSFIWRNGDIPVLVEGKRVRIGAQKYSDEDNWDCCYSGVW